MDVRCTEYPNRLDGDPGTLVLMPRRHFSRGSDVDVRFAVKFLLSTLKLRLYFDLSITAVTFIELANESDKT
jgi:hypothetical protein